MKYEAHKRFCLWVVHYIDYWVKALIDAFELHFYLKQHAKELRAAVKAASSLIDKLEHQMDVNS